MLTVKNWSRHQHYKDRRPPWIKLHRDVMNDMQFMELTMDQRGLLMSLWILAAEADGQLPDDAKTLSWRLRVQNVDVEPLVRAGFLIRVADASNLPPVACLETETEAEERQRQRDNGSSVSLPSTSKESVDLRESLEERETFTRNVVDEFYRIRGYELPEISTRDFALIQRWFDDGIPLRIVLRGMADCLEGIRKRKAKPDYPLTYYDSAVREAEKMWRKAMVGAA